jgi:hypothetical protein
MKSTVTLTENLGHKGRFLSRSRGNDYPSGVCVTGKCLGRAEMLYCRVKLVVGATPTCYKSVTLGFKFTAEDSL